MANIHDIAREVDLSITTVSRVLNGKADYYRIGKKTQKRVREAAERMHYIPNEYAANLRTGKSNTIALSVPSIANPFFGEIASVLDKELGSMGFLTILTESGEDVSMERASLHKLRSRNIEGLIIAPSGDDFSPLEELAASGLPVVCIDRYSKKASLPYVATHNFNGAYKATRLLVDCGHRNIACIQGNVLTVTNEERVAGYRKALQEGGIGAEYIVGNAFDERNGYVETKMILQAASMVTAIFTFSNTIDIGCLKALKEEGLQVGKDISLVTFDENPYLDLLTPALTSIAQPIAEIGSIATKMLVKKLKEEPLIATEVLLNPKLIERDSVCRIPR